MWYPATITAAAEGEPVTSDQVKTQLRINFDDDEVLVGRLIATARAYVEKACGVRLVTQTVAVKCDRFADFEYLPEAPVQSVSSISYIDVYGAEQTLPTSVYEVRSDGLDTSIVLKYGQHWPSILPHSRITVTAVVGYLTAPEAVCHALLLLVAHWYENREAVVVSAGRVVPEVLPIGVEALLCNYRHGI